MARAKSPAKQPLGLTGTTPEEREALSDANDEIIAVRAPNSAIASLPLAGPLRNPGFDTVPWVARPETTKSGLGMYCPSHLHQFTEREMDPKHYPKAHRGEDGQPDRFCWACGRPCREDGLTGKGHRGAGKPCPACGFKRKRQVHPNQAKALSKGQELLRRGYAEAAPGQTPWERVAEIAPKDGVAALKKEERMLKKGRDRADTLTDQMRIQAADRAERIMRPYWESLLLEPKEDWSPSTKLEFYNGQTAIAEKILNRIEGLPVARHRHVDRDDEDVLPEGELSTKVVAKLVSSILAGQDPGELVEDAEFEEVKDDAA